MILALAGQKGGSGKTTTALAIADEWHRRGKRVLVVDLDPQGTARTWHRVAGENNIAGPTVIAMGTNFHRELEPFREAYDHIVLDCPPKEAEAQKRALMISDLVIIPCGPGTTDLWSMKATLDLAADAVEFRPTLQVAILITKRDVRTIQSGDVAASLRATNFPVFETELRNRVEYQEFPASGLGVTRYNPAGKAAAEIKSLVKELEKNYGN